MSVPSFVGYRLFLPCKNLLACSFVRNATFDGNKRLQNGAHTQTLMVHRPSNLKVVKQSNGTHNGHNTTAANASHQKQNDGNRGREIRYNNKYPNDVATTVLVSNETHWYILHIIITTSTVLHHKCLPAFAGTKS